MSVGGVRGGGRGPRAPRSTGAKSGTSKASGAGAVKGASGASRTDKMEGPSGLVGPSGLAGSGNVQGADPLTSPALEIARQLKAGEISSKGEAAKRLVALVLQERLRIKSKALSEKIAKELLDSEDENPGDPRLKQAFERLMSRG